MNATGPSFILTVTCPDRVGIVGAVAGFLASRGALITEAQRFRDPHSDSTLLRIGLEPADGLIGVDRLMRHFATTAAGFGMKWQIYDRAERLRVLIAVSEEGHCLKSLLHRQEVGTLHVEIVGVVSNHPDQRRLVEWYGLPFHHLPIEQDGKAQQEERLFALLDALGANVLVLARYVQILTHRACERLAGRIINIHHSFLPSFRGAKPYHQGLHARRQADRCDGPLRQRMPR